jgi:hypothetical protein
MDKVKKLQEMTGLGLKVSRDIVEKRQITLYIHPYYPGLAWPTMAQAQNVVKPEDWKSIYPYTYQWEVE